MAPLVETGEAATPAAGRKAHGRPGELRYLTRHPILDVLGRVHGYELRFQMGPGEETGENGLRAARTILDDLVLFGFERLTGGLPAFIRCTAEALKEQLVAVLPPSMAVLEVPQGLEPSPKLLAACSKLKKAGFRFSVVDFVWGPAPGALLDLADYVKVDFAHPEAQGYGRLRQRLEGAPVAMMADKVDTQEAYRRACAEGFNFFEGYYFCHPEPLRKAKAPSNRLFHIEILRQLFRDPLNLKELCPLVMRDASLVYRLLRLVNSPVCAMRQEVNSVESAIVILGETAFRRIATLAIQCELNAGQPPEILHMALVRARFCELAAPLGKLDPNEQYLVGMLSLLPAMVRLPMKALAGEFPLRPAIVEALLGAAVPERCLLSWIEAHERGAAVACRAIAELWKLDEEQLRRFYFEAMVWDAAEPGHFA